MLMYTLPTKTWTGKILQEKMSDESMIEREK